MSADQSRDDTADFGRLLARFARELDRLEAAEVRREKRLVRWERLEDRLDRQRRPFGDGTRR